MIKFFKTIALLEGISLLLLLFFAMPMKYIFELPIYVRIIGMAHGLLFITYIVLAIMNKIEEQWDNKKFLLICLASVVPFGTFYIEEKVFQKCIKHSKIYTAGVILCSENGALVTRLQPIRAY